jgi:CRISPR-associated protein Csb2
VLAFEVEYLLGRVFAGDFRDRSKPEWPPHPARLFSALAAAYFDGDASANERKALEWLEQQGPPCVRAGQAGLPIKAVAFVPTNYPGDGVPELRGRQPRLFPGQAPAEATAYFIWPSANPDSEIRDALGGLAGRVAYLGKACSLVRMHLAENAPEPNFVPDPSGMEVLRTFGPGRLSELVWQFEADLRPSDSYQRRYREIEVEGIRAEAVQGDFGEMLIFRKVAGAGLPIEATLTLTSAVRIALMSNAGQRGPIPAIIGGHGSEPHCAIVGLPFTGGKHADGRLMGFSVVLPRTASAGKRRSVIANAELLERRGVHLGKALGSWRVELDMSPAAQSLRPSTWGRRSKRWVTVTPILLDRFPKKKGASVEQILRVACSRVGLPEPISVESGAYSVVAGVPPVPQFRLVRKRDERARWGVHAKFEFPVEVRGPVVLGAGRYFGMGLLKPTEEGDRGD